LAEAWTNKGLALAQQEKYNEALQAFDEAIELNPEYAKAWYYKGVALQQLGRTTDADAAFARAKELGYPG